MIKLSHSVEHKICSIIDRKDILVEAHPADTDPIVVFRNHSPKYELVRSIVADGNGGIGNNQCPCTASRVNGASFSLVHFAGSLSEFACVLALIEDPDFYCTPEIFTSFPSLREKNYRRYSSLIYQICCTKGLSPLLDILVKRGLDLKSNEMNTVFMDLLAQKRFENTEYLVANGVDKNGVLDYSGFKLYLVTRDGDHDAIEEQNKYSHTPAFNNYGTAMEFALMYGDFDTMRALIDAGHSLESPNQGLGCLDAVMRLPTEEEVIKFLDYFESNPELLEQLDVNYISTRKSTAASTAASLGYINALKRLKDRGAALQPSDISSIDAQSPIHNAANYGFGEIVQYLLDEGMDSNSRDTVGMSVLQLVASKVTDRHFLRALIRRLISQGADIHSTEGKSRASALGCAMLSNNMGAVHVLLPHYRTVPLSETFFQVKSNPAYWFNVFNEYFPSNGWSSEDISTAFKCAFLYSKDNESSNAQAGTQWLQGQGLRNPNSRGSNGGSRGRRY